MADIQSVKNPRVVQWKKLLTKKGRDQAGHYIIEGIHLIEEAGKTDEIVEYMIEENTWIPDELLSRETPVSTITTEISKLISSTDTPQGVFAVCRKRMDDVDVRVHKRLLFFDGVQDPGNIGTMIRTADAAGVDAVIFGEGTGDLYNPKVIRSAQGSHFHLAIEKGDLRGWVERCKETGIPVYGTALEDALPYNEVAPQESFALIVGNEGAGMSPDLLQITDRNLYVPIYGRCESLNVGIAAGILLYHLRK